MSYKRLQIISWALRSPRLTGRLRAFVENGGNSVTSFPLTSDDPEFDRALTFCMAEGLTSWDGGTHVALSSLGGELASKVATDGLFEDEREFLTAIKRGLNENRVKTALKSWGT